MAEERAAERRRGENHFLAKTDFLLSFSERGRGERGGGTNSQRRFFSPLPLLRPEAKEAVVSASEGGEKRRRGKSQKSPPIRAIAEGREKKKKWAVMVGGGESEAQTSPLSLCLAHSRDTEEKGARAGVTLWPKRTRPDGAEGHGRTESTCQSRQLVQSSPRACSNRDRGGEGRWTERREDDGDGANLDRRRSRSPPTRIVERGGGQEGSPPSLSRLTKNPFLMAGEGHRVVPRNRESEKGGLDREEGGGGGTYSKGKGKELMKWSRGFFLRRRKDSV